MHNYVLFLLLFLLLLFVVVVVVVLMVMVAAMVVCCRPRCGDANASIVQTNTTFFLVIPFHQWMPCHVPCLAEMSVCVCVDVLDER